MIRRLFWFGLAATAGIVAYRRVTRAARAYTPRGMAASAQHTASGMLDSVREFMADVRDGMAEREAEIHAALAENARAGDPWDEYPDVARDRFHPDVQEGEPDR